MHEKVLIIDDDEITHIISKRMMFTTSFAKKVLAVYNGKEGLDYFANLVKNDDQKEVFPDIVFLDLNMPILNGWDFLDDFIKLYYEKFPFIKIYILSSSNDPEEILKSKNYSCVQDFFIKPLTLENLENLKSNG